MAILICARADAAVIVLPGSARAACEQCGVGIVVSAEGRVAAGLTRICAACAMARLAAGPRVPTDTLPGARGLRGLLAEPGLADAWAFAAAMTARGL
jgi:hypothetical protein